MTRSPRCPEGEAYWQEVTAIAGDGQVATVSASVHEPTSVAPWQVSVPHVHMACGGSLQQCPPLGCGQDGTVGSPPCGLMKKFWSFVQMHMGPLLVMPVMQRFASSSQLHCVVAPLVTVAQQ